MDDKPAEQKEYDSTSSEYPLVLLCASLHHADSFTANSQRVGDSVQSLLNIIHNLALAAQVS